MSVPLRLLRVLVVFICAANLGRLMDVSLDLSRGRCCDEQFSLSETQDSGSAIQVQVH